MYVTLLQDVKGLGKKTERVRVSDAYARNVIIPQGMGIVGEQSAFRIASNPKTHSVSPEAIIQAVSKGIMLQRESNDTSGLYEKVTEKQCVHYIAQLLRCDDNKIQISDYVPLRTVGEHVVIFRVDNHSYQINVSIKAK